MRESLVRMGTARLPVLGALLAALGFWPGAYARAQSADPNSASLTFTIRVKDKFQPFAVTDLAATPAGEKQVSLTWTAPVEDMVLAEPSLDAVASYDVRLGTFSAAELLGDATAWFNAAAPLVFQPPITPVGGRQPQGAVTSLQPAVTYYFGLRSADDSANVSDIDDRARLAGGVLQAKVVVPGIARITDLTGLPGTSLGEVRLVWTEPNRFGATSPLKYEIRVSSLTQMQNGADFANPAVAKPLTAFSATPLPPVGAQGTQAALTLAGLTPGVTYYFALKAVENAPFLPFTGDWLRNDLTLNVTNFAQAFHLPIAPDAVTNLTSLEGPIPASIALNWTAPDAPGGAPVDRYILRYSTTSAAELGGDTTAWFNLANSTAVLVAPQAPGVTVSTQIFNLEFGDIFYFGLRAVDILGRASDIDLQAKSVSGQVKQRPKPGSPIGNLSAFTGDNAGEIRLAWTEPLTNGLFPPFFYDIRVSSEELTLPGTGVNIEDNSQFDAALPLAAVSPSVSPAPNPAGGNDTAFVVTGLTAEATYYFAIRLIDSHPLPVKMDWVRLPAQNINVRNFAAAKFLPGTPEAVTNLSALTGASEGQVALTWTSPKSSNFARVAKYEVRWANFSVDNIGGDPDAWWNQAAASASVVNVLPKPPGSGEAAVVGGLFPLTTFYFGLRAIDKSGIQGAVDERSATLSLQPYALPKNEPPAVPSGLLASGGLREALLDWPDLPAGIGGKGLDFSHYILQRSTAQDFSAQVVEVTTTTALSYLDKPLAAFTTFYFRLGAVDQGGLASAYSAPASSATPFTIRPQQPFGIEFERTGSSVTLSWMPTKSFEDGTLFFSTAAPSADELTGYELYRTSSGACSPFEFITQAAYDATSVTDTVSGGNAYYYLIRSSNTYFTSKDSVIVTPFGSQIFQLEDCASNAEVPPEQLPMINGGSEPILISRRTLTSEHGGKVMKSVEFVPMLGGQTPLNDFHFDKPIEIVLRYEVDAAGAPTPQGVAAASAQGTGVQGLGTAAGAEAQENLGVFWNNGVEYKKLYGKVSKADQTVRVQTPNLGRFQLRTVLREGTVTLDLSNITSRVMTPNGDGKNDVILFLFDNPNNVEVKGAIYDMRGAFVADMFTSSLLPNTLQWDGRSNGTVVTSGVYIYQIEGEGKKFNGTIVVAR